MSILEAFLAGKEARRTADAAEQINAMQQFIGQNGKAIMGGDANALGQLAGFGQQGLQMAMGIQGDTQTRERQAAADAAAAEDRAYGRERDKVADGRADQQPVHHRPRQGRGLDGQDPTQGGRALEARVMGRRPRSTTPTDSTARVRMTPEERAAADALRARWGLPSLSEAIRRAVREAAEREAIGE